MTLKASILSYTNMCMGAFFMDKFGLAVSLVTCDPVIPCQSPMIMLMTRRFGFGLMRAIEMVELAEVWVNVGDREKCELKPAASRLPRYPSVRMLYAYAYAYVYYADRTRSYFQDSSCITKYSQGIFSIQLSMLCTNVNKYVLVVQCSKDALVHILYFTYILSCVHV